MCSFGSLKMFHILVPAPQFKLHPEMVEQTRSPRPFALGVPKLHCYCLKRMAKLCSSSRMPHVCVTSLQSDRHNQSLVLRHRYKSAHKATMLPAGVLLPRAFAAVLLLEANPLTSACAAPYEEISKALMKAVLTHRIGFTLESVRDCSQQLHSQC